MRQFVSVVIISSFLILNTAAFSHDQEHHESRKIYHKYASMVRWKALEEGLRMSKSLKKPMMVDFGVEKGCHRSEFMQKNVYTNYEIVEKIKSDFIPIFINLARPLSSEDIALGDKYDYKNACLLLFVNHESEIIEAPYGGDMCYAGNMETRKFIAYLDYIN